MKDTRNRCLEYVTKNYPDWPAAYETGHTVACHYGYSWILDGEWRLENELSGDLISNEDYNNYKANPPVPPQVRIDSWKAEAALLLIKQCHVSLKEAIEFADAAYKNIGGDIENETPQDCVDAEIEAMRESI